MSGRPGECTKIACPIGHSQNQHRRPICRLIAGSLSAPLPSTRYRRSAAIVRDQPSRTMPDHSTPMPPICAPSGRRHDGDARRRFPHRAGWPATPSTASCGRARGTGRRKRGVWLVCRIGSRESRLETRRADASFASLAAAAGFDASALLPWRFVEPIRRGPPNAWKATEPGGQFVVPCYLAGRLGAQFGCACGVSAPRSRNRNKPRSSFTAANGRASRFGRSSSPGPNRSATSFMSICPSQLSACVCSRSAAKGRLPSRPFVSSRCRRWPRSEVRPRPN